MNKILISFAAIILTIIFGGIIGYLSYDPADSLKLTETPHLVKIEKVTQDMEFINPEKYATIQGFLEVLDTQSGCFMGMDISTDDFYIVDKSISGSVAYIRVGSGELRTDFQTISGEKKNLIIEDIFKAYKSCLLIPERSKKYPNGVRILAESELPLTMQLHNKILAVDPKNSFFMMRDALEKKGDKTPIETASLAYMYDYSGDYKKARFIRQSLDKTNTPIAEVHIFGVVRDSKGVGISGAKVELLNNTNFSTITDASGAYKLDISSVPNSRLRIRATDKNHSDPFSAISVFDPLYDQREERNFVLHTPDVIVDIDLDKDTHNGVFIIKTKQTTYTIPADALVNTDGTATTKRKFRAYLYEFNKHTDMNSYLYNDTFDVVYGYVGNIMKTFGMPYMQIFDLEGTEVHIRKTHPALLTNNIYHMKELYENYDKIYTAISDQDMQYLVEESKKGGFPISREWLIKNNFLRWPGWWMLNRTKGVWETVPHRVTDTKGIIDTIYYTID